MTVLTPQFQRDWPDETDRSGVRIVRLSPPGGGAWGEWRYVQRLTKAIRARGGETDAVLVGGLRGDAYAALATARGGPAVVLQPEQPGLAGDCHWQVDSPCGVRVKRRCYRAGAYFALTPLLEREVIAAGYARSRIHPVPLGVPIPTPSTLAVRREARRTLAQADPALTLDADDRLFVYAGRLRMDGGLEQLLAAWRRAAAEASRAVLWLVGEGPDAARLRELAAETSGNRRIHLTGAFDDLDDVYRAADAVVAPALTDGLAATVLEAAAYGLPTIVSDIVTHRDYLTPELETLAYARNDVEALTSQIIRFLNDAALGERLGSAARERVSREHSLARMADEYERLLREIAVRRL